MLAQFSKDVNFVEIDVAETFKSGKDGLKSLTERITGHLTEF